MVYLATVATVIILFTTLLFRNARILMLHFFSGIRDDTNSTRR